MHDTDGRLPEHFYLTLERLLDEHAGGIREHDLIRLLQAEGFFDFLSPPPAGPQLLYRAHFLLFHALYRLADRLAGARAGRLQIGPLWIRRLPWHAGETALAAPDAVRDYYLDWHNLDGMSEQDVSELIDAFWRRYARSEGRSEALAELGLQDPVDDATIKRTWRRLAMEHHPDRGGDKARLQAINEAVERLLGRA